MAVCRFCCREMQHTSGCDQHVLHDAGEPAPRIPYGREWRDGPERCGDCGVVRGRFHHPGCDIERCATCGRQAISCDCRYDEDQVVDDDWGWDDEREHDRPPLPVIDPFTTRDPPALLGFESMRSALVLRHGHDLATFSEWASAQELPVREDAALLCLATVPPPIGDRLTLTRPCVVSMMHRAHFVAEEHRVTLPDGLAQAMSGVVRWLADSGRIWHSSDPLEALLEPLAAHFMPELPSSDHICECFARHDPDRKDDERLLPLWTGHTVRARRIDGGTTAVPSPEALTRFRARLQEVWRGARPVDLSSLALLGVLDATSRRPRLWFHGLADDPGRYRSLLVDDDGTPYAPKLDRRYRAGHRWEQVGLGEARWRAGLDRPSQRRRSPIWTI